MNKGDYTVHWSGKVCRVDEIAEMDFTGAKRQYLVLLPIRDKSEKIYVPIEKTEGVLRPVLSREAAEALIAGFGGRSSRCRFRMRSSARRSTRRRFTRRTTSIWCGLPRSSTREGSAAAAPGRSCLPAICR